GGANRRLHALRRQRIERETRLTYLYRVVHHAHVALMWRRLMEPNAAFQHAMQTIGEQHGIRKPAPIIGFDLTPATAAALLAIDENHGAERAIRPRRAPIPTGLAGFDSIRTGTSDVPRQCPESATGAGAEGASVRRILESRHAASPRNRDSTRNPPSVPSTGTSHPPRGARGAFARAGWRTRTSAFLAFSSRMASKRPRSTIKPKRPGGCDRFSSA